MGAKHKKTRKQKITADFNHQVYSLVNKNVPLNISSPSAVINKNSYSYTYVLTDITKTGLLTAFIIAVQLVLFFLLKNHIITLPKISY
jgi:hypothetical protein